MRETQCTKSFAQWSDTERAFLFFTLENEFLANDSGIHSNQGVEKRATFEIKKVKELIIESLVLPLRNLSLRKQEHVPAVKREHSSPTTNENIKDELVYAFFKSPESSRT